mgnify:CR=1 FL=1
MSFHKYFQRLIVTGLILITGFWGCQSPVTAPDTSENSPEYPGLKLVQANLSALQPDGLALGEGSLLDGGIVWKADGGSVGGESLEGNGVTFPPQTLKDNHYITFEIDVNADDVLVFAIDARARIDVNDGPLSAEAKNRIETLTGSLIETVDVTDKTEIRLKYEPGNTEEIRVDHGEFVGDQANMAQAVMDAIVAHGLKVEVRIVVDPAYQVGVNNGQLTAAMDSIVRDLIGEFETNVVTKKEIQVKYDPGHTSAEYQIKAEDLTEEEWSFLQDLMTLMEKSDQQIELQITVESGSYHLQLESGMYATLAVDKTWLEGQPDVAVNLDNLGEYYTARDDDDQWYAELPHCSRWSWGILD